MSGKKGSLSRRDLLKTACAAGLGSVLEPLSSGTQAAYGSASSMMPERSTVPPRSFGKTGVDVSMLALGGVLGMSDQLVFRQAPKMGVTYWDTADSYGWGRNEKAIGKYFAKFPDDRKKVFLVTKASTSDPQKLTEKLTASLARMNTSYVDHNIPISDILRYSMYCHSYGDRARAQTLFRALPADVKANILKTDFSKAEKHCPQKIQIGKVLKKTLIDLS